MSRPIVDRRLPQPQARQLPTVSPAELRDISVPGNAAENPHGPTHRLTVKRLPPVQQNGVATFQNSGRPGTGNLIAHTWARQLHPVKPVADSNLLHLATAQPDGDALFDRADESPRPSGQDHVTEHVAGPRRGIAATDSRQPTGVLLVPPSNPKTVTLHLNETDVRPALEMLSQQGGLNILVAPEVTGTVTANFQAVSIDKALDAVLKLCGLVAQREGDLIFVFTQNEVPQIDLQVQVFPLDYVAAEEIVIAVQGLLTTAGKAFTSMTNTSDHRRAQEAIVVMDIPASIQRIRQYVTQMDQPPRQVMIEAHVLLVDLKGDLKHGVNYKQIFGAGGFEIDITGMANPTDSPALFARIKGGDVNGLLECLRTTTNAKTLASPRLMVVNGQLARIQVGEQLGYRTTTVTETAAVEAINFLDLGVVLEVTPHISRDDHVLMHVRPEVSSGRINPDSQLPEEETAELQTDVLLESGQGVVIGGLIKESVSDIQSMVPWLGDLKHIGWMFKRKNLEKARSEIIVTLVPRVVPYPIICPENEVINAARCQTPLFQSELDVYPRPWEGEYPAKKTVWPGRWHRGGRCICGDSECAECNPPSQPGSPEPIPLPNGAF